MHGDVVGGLPAAREDAERAEEREAIGVVEVEQAVVGGGEEVARDGADGVEGERGDGGGRVEERAEVGSGPRGPGRRRAARGLARRKRRWLGF